MNKYDGIMIGKKSLDDLKANTLRMEQNAIIDQVGRMIESRVIMDQIELTQALCDMKASTDQSDDYTYIPEDVIDLWTDLINSGKEEALKNNKTEDQTAGGSIGVKPLTKPPLGETPYFNLDSEELKRNRLNFADFMSCVKDAKTAESLCVFIAEGYGLYMYTNFPKDIGLRKPYTKDMNNLHGITEDKFHELVREGYDCWEVECFEKPKEKIGGRLNWSHFKFRLHGCLSDGGTCVAYCDDDSAYSYFDNIDFAEDYNSSPKRTQITKDIKEEEFYKLVGEGYNVFEVVEKKYQPEYDYDNFKYILDAAVEDGQTLVEFDRDQGMYVYSSDRIPGGEAYGEITDEEAANKDSFLCAVSAGIKYFKVLY